MRTTKFTEINESIFSKMSKMATKYQAVNLSQGFPNFDSDPVLIDLVHQAMRNEFNQYAPMAGDFELREQISLKIAKLHHKVYNPATEITVTAGATQAIFAAIAATISTGDEVLIFNPAYDCYEPTIKLFGGIPVPIQLKPPTYKVDWEEVKEKVSSRTRLIIINTPHNPSGMIFSESDMLQLETIAEEYDLFVISDEVYEHIIFDDKQHYSAARFPKLSQRTYIVASFGKTFHNTGWKLGYCVASEALMTSFQMVHQYNVFCVNHPMQKALATYLKNANNYLNLGHFYQDKRDYIITSLKDSRFGILPSEGTYFQLLDYSNISNEADTDFAERLTKEYKLATIPTSVFNSNGEDFKQIRICFAKIDTTLETAVDILKSIR